MGKSALSYRHFKSRSVLICVRYSQAILSLSIGKQLARKHSAARKKKPATELAAGLCSFDLPDRYSPDSGVTDLGLMRIRLRFL